MPDRSGITRNMVLPAGSSIIGQVTLKIPTRAQPYYQRDKCCQIQNTPSYQNPFTGRDAEYVLYDSCV